MIPLVKSTFFNERKTKQVICRFIRKQEKLSFSTECERFEKAFAKWQERKQCVFLNSGSSANLAIIQALLNLGMLKKGDYVGFSALTWSTNVMPLIELGLQAVPIDVELDTLNVSHRQFLRTLSHFPIKMLFLTNALGFCDDIDRIAQECKKRYVLLVEDNCESLGTVYKGKKLGNFGIASTFSFYVGHHMSTIEGGAVCTNNERIVTMLRLVRAHGWDRNLSFAKQNKIRNKFKVNSTFYSRYTFYDLGYNLRPTEINGFIGTTQIQYLPIIIKKRQENFLMLADAIYQKSNMYYPIRYSHIDVVSNFAIPIICRTQKIRDMLVKRCEGIIEIRPIIGGDMMQQPFFKKYTRLFGKLPNNKNAKLIHEQGLYFGNNPELTQKEKQLILRIFTKHIYKINLEHLPHIDQQVA